MALAAFDTLQIFEDLEKAGFEESKAKAISAVVRRAHESADFATKRDIDDLRKDMDAKFAGMDAKLASMEERSDAKHESLRKDMDAKFDVLRAEMAAIKWGLGIIGAGIVAMLVKTFF